MRILSWNVNGLRACAKKGFGRFLSTSKADIIALQEVRAFPEQLDDATRSPKGWHTNFFPAERPGYSGVAIYSRQLSLIGSSIHSPMSNSIGKDVSWSRTSDAWRWRACIFRKAVAGIGTTAGCLTSWTSIEAVFERIETLRRRGPVFVTGDYNTAHAAIDLARPKSNQKASGFLPEERAELDRWIAAGWVDAFRAQHPEEPDHYTWWRQFWAAPGSERGLAHRLCIRLAIGSQNGFDRHSSGRR